MPSRTEYVHIDGHALAVTLHEPDTTIRGVPEAFVQALWEDRSFTTTALRTVHGHTVRIISGGQPNDHAGPDFLGATLSVDGLPWHGDVEIHTRSAFWNQHGHHRDPRYNGVVLHVCLQADTTTGTLVRADGSALDELILAPYLHHPVQRALHAYRTAKAPPFLCAPLVRHVPQTLLASWLGRLGKRRLALKAERARTAHRHGASFDQVLYEALFEGLGYVPNAAPMRALAQRVPLALVRAHAPAAEILRGSLLHLSGLSSANPAGHGGLAQPISAWGKAIAAIPPLLPTQWKRSRLRPANAPHRRLAQGVAWLAPGGLLRDRPLARLRHALTSSEPAGALSALLRPATDTGPVGLGRAHQLIVNAVIPTLLATLHPTLDLNLRRRLLDLPSALPPPSTSLVRTYQEAGLAARSALDVQGVYHLHARYCTPTRCLSCRIGQHLLPGPSASPTGPTDEDREHG
ncbi:MAG: DUF2851 family protein [Bacteroidota bacterium]